HSSFISSRRRHTRTYGDWSSDVCSSDLDTPKGQKVVVLSYGLWTRRFGGDPNIIGQSITLGGEPYTVIGILGSGFDVEGLGTVQIGRASCRERVIVLMT